MRYYEVKPKEWVGPIRRGYKFCCCDCGLVHTLNFKIVKGRIYFQADRDNRATGQVRRHIEKHR